jgi:8-oxo-dGTP diphosphatase
MPRDQPIVRVAVGVFVLESAHHPNRNPRCLMGKRKNALGAGTYGHPGGHLEFGETAEECAARETLEETGLRVTNIRFLTATNGLMLDEGKHFITLWMVGARENEQDEPQLLEPDKCEGWQWVEWAEMLAWVKAQLEAKNTEPPSKRVFAPVLHLLQQRPGVIPTLARVAKTS